MSDAVYHIVEHDGGWAYKLGDVFSETFPNRQLAEGAARRVAEEQRSPGEDEAISWEDERGIWHDEAARGSDRPNAYVAPDERVEGVHGLAQSGQRPRGEVRTQSLTVMLLTIALAYILGIVVGRNA